MLLSSKQMPRCPREEVGPVYEVQGELRLQARVRKLAALAFIPVADLITTYEALADTFEDDELQLLVYFESTWIGAEVAGRRGRRSPPLFAHEIWNVVGRHHTGSLVPLAPPTLWRRSTTHSTLS